MLLMNARLMGQCSHLPSRIIKPKNRKDVMRNDVIGHLSELGLKWSGNDASSAGEALVRSLTNCLWYIDGQHEVLSRRSDDIPECFQWYSGYNRPELSKHRKRTLEKMSSVSLRTYSDTLFSCLQGVYWEDKKWSNFKPSVENLARSLPST